MKWIRRVQCVPRDTSLTRFLGWCRLLPKRVVIKVDKGMKGGQFYRLVVGPPVSLKGKDIQFVYFRDALLFKLIRYRG